MFIAWLTETINFKLHWMRIQLLQEMWHRHRDLHCIAGFQTIPGNGQRFGDPRIMTTCYGIAPQGLHHGSMQIWHPLELLPGQRAMAPGRIDLCLDTLKRAWMGEESIEHETEGVRHRIDPCQHRSKGNMLQDG